MKKPKEGTGTGGKVNSLVGRGECACGHEHKHTKGNSPLSVTQHKEQETSSRFTQGNTHKESHRTSAQAQFEEPHIMKEMSTGCTFDLEDFVVVKKKQGPKVSKAKIHAQREEWYTRTTSSFRALDTEEVEEVNQSENGNGVTRARARDRRPVVAEREEAALHAGINASPATTSHRKIATQKSSACNHGTLNCFLDPESGALMTLAVDDIDTQGMECISVRIDSGASDSVLPTRECPDTTLEETARSAFGYACEAAGGHRSINEGQRNITFFSQDGDLNTMDFQVADVNKPLGSVAELVDAGHKVVFEKAGAYIQNEQGRRTRLRRSNGMWYMDCWRIPHAIASSPCQLEQLFARQG